LSEQGKKAVIPLKETTSGSQWPVRVGFKASPLTPAQVSVEIEIPNPGKKVLQLDGPSVAENGEISNSYFKVVADGKERPYGGRMAKRAPPKFSSR
jgi:hypothetical protein